MTNILKINLLFAMLAIVAVFGMTSCTTEDPISATGDQTYDFVSFGTLVETVQVSNLDLNNEMMLLNEMEPQRIEKGGMLAGKVPMYRFKDIFAKLNLTDEQKTLLDPVFKEHIDCATSARKAFFEKIQSIMEEANAQRKDILDQVKAGTLDKVAAKELLKTLNTDTQAKITATGAQEELKAALKLCLDELIAKIQGILVGDQLTAFNDWLAKGGSNIGTGNGGGKGPGNGGKDPGNGGKDPGNGGKDPGNGGNHGTKPGIRLFDTLQFSADQIVQANDFFKLHNDCDKVAHDAYNTKVAPFFEEARVARQSVMDQLKSGLIDKATAQQLLQTIETELKDKITASGAQAELEAAMILCDTNLKSSLESIMSPEQVALFEDLLAKNLITLHGPGIGPKK